jgi:hypothetical protein
MHGLRLGHALGDDGDRVVEQVEADNQRRQQPEDVAVGAAGVAVRTTRFCSRLLAMVRDDMRC